MEGIALFAEDGMLIAEHIWSRNPQGQWISRAIPQGMTIIGMSCDTEFQYHISALAFRLWFADI